MFLLIAFAFLAGVVTILSPCILPILPIVLSSTIGGEATGKGRPLGVVTGFVLSFTFFTLFLSTIVRVSGIPADSLRGLSIVIIGLFGASLLIPKFQELMEQIFSKLTAFVPKSGQKSGFGGGVLIGLSLGLLWTPCVGPILASVISLAITGSVNFEALLITLAYSIGTAIPMFLIIAGGQNTLRKVPWLLANTAKIQKAFGVLMILTAILIYFNIDRRFQTYILQTFPNYGVGLTKIEDNAEVKKQLGDIGAEKIKEEDMGKPSFTLLNPKGTIAPELIPGGAWFNSEPLTLQGLRGKVVLIDFWTYSCINCQRTLPYLRAWNEKYKDKGLVIIGVHSPEFEFEKSQKNVLQALTDFKLEYPIVQDNNFATWRAYNNRYWPAKYFIDKEGYIRYSHFGEGEYDESERVIQDLLKETGVEGVSSEINNPEYNIESRTPEIYLGWGRIDYLSSAEMIQRDTLATYSKANSLSRNMFAMEGEFEVKQEYSNPKKGAKLYLDFEAKEVFLVMRPKSGKSEVKVYLDGETQFPGEDNINGNVMVEADRLYKLIKLPRAGRHELRLEFEDDNTEIFAFTFG